jgi:Fe2+ transport system protein B
MENTITRIADLPNSMNNSQQQQPNIQIQPTHQVSKPSELPNNYVPINVHPNPYGVSDQNPIMSPPEQINSPQQELMNNTSTQQVPQYLSEEQREMIMPREQQRLPSRHIQQDTTQYAQDEQVQPNYIPKEQFSKDYVREYEEFTDKNIQHHERELDRNQKIDDILTDLQVPIFVSILYFMFQLPIINAYIFKRFSFLSIYNDDGNFKFYGLVFKSWIFGSIYYFVTKVTNFLISL